MFKNNIFYNYYYASRKTNLIEIKEKIKAKIMNYLYMNMIQKLLQFQNFLRERYIALIDYGHHEFKQSPRGTNKWPLLKKRNKI